MAAIIDRAAQRAEYAAQFMAAMRGIPAHHVASAMTDTINGVIYSGCSKARLAECFASIASGQERRRSVAGIPPAELLGKIVKEARANQERAAQCAESKRKMEREAAERRQARNRIIRWKFKGGLVAFHEAVRGHHCEQGSPDVIAVARVLFERGFMRGAAGDDALEYLGAEQLPPPGA